jgi:hypothetical protein
MVLRGKPAFNEAGGLDLVLIDAAATRTRDSADPQRADARQRARGKPAQSSRRRRPSACSAGLRIGDVVSKPGRYELVVNLRQPPALRATTAP